MIEWFSKFWNNAWNGLVSWINGLNAGTDKSNDESFNLQTLLLTVFITAAVTLIFDWWARPRLEVRNERFKLRAQDRLTLLKTLRRSVMICGQLQPPPTDVSERVALALQKNGQELRDELLVCSTKILECITALPKELGPEMTELLSTTQGYIKGLCWSDEDHHEVGKLAYVPLGLALSAASSTQSIRPKRTYKKKIREFLDSW